MSTTSGFRVISNEQVGHGDVLCVDLDGSLIQSDLLYECLIQVLKTNPLLLFLIPLWLLGGRARLKEELALRANLDIVSLPFNPLVVEFVASAKAQGATVVLATASHEVLAKCVAAELGYFDEVIATTGDWNCKGAAKARRLASRFGEQGFYYIGDSRADAAVWRVSKGALVVGSEKCARRLVPSGVPLLGVFMKPSSTLRSAFRALRVHQWVKNSLLFAPLVLAQQWMQLDVLVSVAVAFLAFSFTASGVYMLNDLCDLDADRRHHSKRQRPFASGSLPLQYGIVLVPLLWAAAALLSVFVPVNFAFTLIAYLIVTSLYSFLLKRLAVVDVLTLASLYTLRIFAGAMAAGVLISHWFFAFSMFLFFSLAAVKRYSELHQLLTKVDDGVQSPMRELGAHGRGYTTSDLPLLSAAGLSSAYISVLVLALYVSAEDALLLYHSPELLWFFCLLLLYWLTRVWLLTHRGHMHDDPIVFALRDPVSHGLTVLAAALFLLATFGASL